MLLKNSFVGTVSVGCILTYENTDLSLIAEMMEEGR